MAIGIIIFLYSFYMELREQSVNPEIVETDQILENGQEVQNVNEEVVNPEAVTAEEPTKEQLIEQGNLLSKNQYGKHLLRVANDAFKESLVRGKE